MQSVGEATERDFTLPAATLAALEWGRPGDFPIVALHGWLDNASSFEPLAPLLSDCHVLAVDAAGHGRSGFRSPDASYDIWDDVRDVIAVADALEWREFAIVAHSRGAAVATLLAGAFPARVRKLVLIEGGVPLTGAASEAPATLAQSILDHERLRGRTGRTFATRELAIHERCMGFTRVTRESAEILARRSLRAVEGGYVWHVDQRLKAKSEIRLSRAQAKAFIAAVTAPVLAILAESSPFAQRARFRELLAEFGDLELVELPGGHHLHMEGAQADIAARMLRFFGVRH